MKTISLYRVLAVAMTLGFAAALVGYDAAPAFAQSTKSTEKGNKSTEKASKSQSDKKPAASCEGMDKKSKAYSDCVKAQAQTTQDTRKEEQAAKKSGSGKKGKTQ